MMQRRSAMRRYPPLTGALVAALLAVFVLPSALNVPQSNPTQTLEFAPVPPEDDAPPPPASGNLSSLSLGGSTTAPAGEALGGDEGGPAAVPPPPPIPDGSGAKPITKRCVGNPPRQTEDPLSPPCVAHFEGDNGGATYQGVAQDEVTVLFYLDTSSVCAGCPGATGTARGSENAPRNTYDDLWEAEQADDFIDTRALRRFQAYFNDRYQLYGRKAHFWIYYHRGPDSNTPEGRRADAVANYEKLRPFAAFSYTASFTDDYLDVMVDKGVLNFGSRSAKSEEFFQRSPGLIWSYPPTLEQQADNYAGYVCRSVLGRPAVAAGDIDGDGQPDTDRPRRLGMLYAADEGKPNLAAFAMAVSERIEACGGEIVVERSFPQANAFESTANRSVATQNMAAFQTEGVTTIIWPGGHETEHSKTSRRVGYYPEWVIAGDNQMEGFGPTMFQDQDVWHEHAWTVTPMAAVSPVEQRSCYRALTEADQSMPDGDKSYVCGLRTYYEDLRQLFTGIQVAGPRLSPDSVDQGFHAIPPHLSPNPDAPACFYLPGDYTCVKDGTVGWWDRSATNGEGLEGCYRLVEGGRRYTADSWPEDRGLTGASPTDPCMTFQGNAGAGRTITG